MVTVGGANFSVMTVPPRRTFTRKWYRPVSAETGGPYCANRVPGRTLGGTTAFQRTQVPGVAAHAVRATHAQCQLSQDSFPALAGAGSLPGKHPPVGLNKSPDARDQSQSAANRHRSERAHPRLPWHSQCPLAGIGRGTECCAWLDAPRFAAKPQVQGRLASGEEFGPLGEYAPTALTIKPDLFDRTMTVRASPDRSWATAREDFRRQNARPRSCTPPKARMRARLSKVGNRQISKPANRTRTSDSLKPAARPSARHVHRRSCRYFRNVAKYLLQKCW